MLDSKEFWSQGAYRAKVKTPFEMVASSVRALDAQVMDAFALANQVANLGEPLYRKQEPTGYSNLELRMGELVGAAGAHELRDAACAEPAAGSSEWMRRGSAAIRKKWRKTLLFRTVSPQTRAAHRKGLGRSRSRRRRRWWPAW